MSNERIMQEGPRLSDYVRVLWRRKWLVSAVTAFALAAAIGMTYTATPVYRAVATLIYETPLNVADPLSGSSYMSSTDRATDLDSVASVIASPDIATAARQRLSNEDIAAGYAVSAGPPKADTATGITTGSTVLVTVESRSAAAAAHAANAYARAFTDYRKAQAQTQVQRAQRVIENQLANFKGAKSAEYYTLVQRLQDLKILEATVTGNFRVLVPATIPQAPFSPNPSRNIPMGLVGGLFVGIALALLLEQFDTRVRSSQEVATIMAMPVVGTVPRVSKKKVEVQPLAVVADPYGPMAEAIRKVRSNLEFANVDGDVRSLAITSSFQGEGKSLLACNLALSVAATGRRVVLVDADLRRPRVHVYFGLGNAEGVSLVLTGKTALRTSLRSVAVRQRFGGSSASGTMDSPGSEEHLDVLTSGPLPPDPAEIVASRSFGGMIADLRDDYDLVIVDSPALLAVGDTAAMSRSVDGLLYVVDLLRARRPALQEAARQVAQVSIRKLGLVIIGSPSAHRYVHEYGYITDDEPVAHARNRNNSAGRGKVMTRQ